MKSINECIEVYKKQLQNGDIQKAYRSIMEFMLHLRSRLSDKYQDYSVPGNIYFGYMDMTYFSFTPPELKERKLKIAIVFLHDKTCFEVWLAGANKQIQSQYWRAFKESGIKKYRTPDSIKGVDSILEYEVCPSPDFDNLPRLSKTIEEGTIKFIKDIINLVKQN